MTATAGADILGFMAADVSGKTHVAFDLFFLAGEANFIGVDNDDEIAGIDVRSENGFGFATEEIGGAHGNSAEDLVLGIDEPPFAGNLVRFGRESLHAPGKGHGSYGRAGGLSTAGLGETGVGAVVREMGISGAHNFHRGFAERPIHQLRLCAGILAGSA
jgi:hypothetical protein